MARRVWRMAHGAGGAGVRGEGRGEGVIRCYSLLFIVESSNCLIVELFNRRIVEFIWLLALSALQKKLAY
jgi:hypothetical protein